MRITVVGLGKIGLPLAVQLIGRRDHEGELFDAARWCEDAIRGRQLVGAGFKPALRS